MSYFGRKSPRYNTSSLSKRSLHIAVIAIVSIGILLHQVKSSGQLSQSGILQSMVMIIWLSVASSLIRSAISHARRFEKRAKEFLDEDVKHSLISRHTDWFYSIQSVVFGSVFAGIGFAIVFLLNMESPTEWSFIWYLVVCSTFYYAGTCRRPLDDKARNLFMEEIAAMPLFDCK